MHIILFQAAAVVSCMFVVVSTLCLIVSTLPMFQQKDHNGIARKYACRGRIHQLVRELAREMPHRVLVKLTFFRKKKNFLGKQLLKGSVS